MFRQFILSTALALSIVAPAGAGEVADQAARTEAALQAGNGAEAIEAAREALFAVWRAAPMAITKSVFVTADAGGYGLYTARDNNVFAQGEPILIYLEPVGFAWKEEGGLYSSLMVVDFEIMSPQGEVLAGQKNFGQFEFHSHAQNTEYMANLTLNLTGAPAGSYVLGITLRDRHGGQTAVAEMPFEIQ